MEVLAVFTALNYSGSFGKNFVKLKKKIKMLFTGLGRSVFGKLCLCLEGIVFPNTDLPALTTNFFVAHAPRNLFGAILIFSARFCGFSTERSTPFCDIFWKGMEEYDKFTTISNSVDTCGVCWLFG